MDKTRPLNEQRKRFCELIVQGLPATQAYKQAGYKGKGHTADSNASRMLNNAEVLTYIDKLRSKTRSKAIKTATEVKEGLSRLLTAAEAKGDSAGFVALANRLAKMEGHDEPDKIDQNVKHAASDEIAARVLGSAPLIALRLQAAQQAVEDSGEEKHPDKPQKEE